MVRVSSAARHLLMAIIFWIVGTLARRRHEIRPSAEEIAVSRRVGGRAAKVYLATIGARERVRRLNEATFDGLWLGLLTPDDLRRVDRAFYASATEPVDGSPRTYGEPEHVLQGLSAWEVAATDDFVRAARVVVTSAGAGREVHGLLSLGFDAVGYEPNELLVAAGREVLEEPDRLRECDYDLFPNHDGQVDAIVIGWGSYMLVRPRAARLELLDGARQALAPGGMLLVSYFDRPPTRYFAIVKAVGNVVRRLLRRVPLELGDALSPNAVHYFTESEIRAELDAAGFDVLRTAQSPYGHAVARRRDV